MNKVVALSGWGQPYDALKTVAPEAVHIHYAAADSPEQALATIARQAADADAVIGWSLGGQLAARAIAQKRIAPRRLVLIAAPFQFVESDSLNLGMPREAFAQFRRQYEANPRRALKKFASLIARGDARQNAIAALLGQPVEQPGLLCWLDELARFSAQSLDFSAFPPTILLHGLQDVVVHPDQSRAYADRIPNAALELWPQASHAPHLHDLERFKHWMAGHAA